MSLHPSLTSIICLGGGVLLVAPFTRWRLRWANLRWPSFAIFIAGVMAECYVVLEFVVERLGRQSRWFELLSHFQSIAGGTCIGLVFAYQLFYY